MMNPPTRARNPIEDLRSREGVLCAAMNLPVGERELFLGIYYHLQDWLLYAIRVVPMFPLTYVDSHDLHRVHWVVFIAAVLSGCAGHDPYSGRVLVAG